MKSRLVFLFALFAAGCGSVRSVDAQATGDGRGTITPPASYPTTCNSLTATKTISSLGEPSSETDDITPGTTLSCTGSGTGSYELKVGTSGQNAFVLGPVSLESGMTLLIDQGVTVFASLNVQDYDTTPGTHTCGYAASGGSGCKALITVADYSSTTPGGIMGKGVINGRGGDVMSNIISACSGTGCVSTPGYSWWEMTDYAAASGLTQNSPTLVTQTSSSTFIRNNPPPSPAGSPWVATNFIIYQTSFVNAPKNHIAIKGCLGCTIYGITINTPWSTGNTDGIDISDSQNVTVMKSTINDGDDMVAMGSGYVTPGQFTGGPAGTYSYPTSQNISVLESHFFSGHGTSIGSDIYSGVSNVLVDNNSYFSDYLGANGASQDTVTGAINIKSNPTDTDGDLLSGQNVSSVQYSNLCLQNVAKPIQFNPFYKATTGGAPALMTGIYVANIHDVSTTTPIRLQLQGYDSSHMLGLWFNNVVFDTLASCPHPSSECAVPLIGAYGMENVAWTLGPGQVASDGYNSGSNDVLLATIDGGPSSDTITTKSGFPNSTAARDCSVADNPDIFGSLAENSGISWYQSPQGVTPQISRSNPWYPNAFQLSLGSGTAYVISTPYTSNSQFPYAVSSSVGGSITYTATPSAGGTPITVTPNVTTLSALGTGSWVITATYTPGTGTSYGSYATVTSSRALSIVP